jgi:phosphoglycerol transferase MdoB-like AlkP superfamily enzyme
MLRAMWVLPLGAAIVALVFSGLLGRQWLARRRPFQAAWLVALLMYAAASFALFLGVADGWSVGEFRVYWAFGAILNVPWLALGEGYLLVRRRWVMAAALVGLVFLTAFVVAQIRSAPIRDAGALASDLPLGREVFGDGSTPHRLAQWVAYPAYGLLLAGCIWSAWRMRGDAGLRDRFVGTVLIAVGATVVAVGSGVGAGLDVVPVFTVGLVVGIAVMFWGFLRASRPVAQPPEGRRTPVPSAEEGQIDAPQV